jgi:hypothetical protein
MKVTILRNDLKNVNHFVRFSELSEENQKSIFPVDIKNAICLHNVKFKTFKNTSID